MSFEDAFDEMSEDLIGDYGFGIPAVFYPRVGDSINLNIVFDQAYEGRPGGHFQVGSGYQKTVEYLFSDIGRLALPNEKFVFSGATHEVIAPVEHDGGGRFAKVIVK